jgi:hypothetical protein
MTAPPTQPVFAVVRTDYLSSAIALIGEDATPIERDFVDSGSRVSTLTTALSGDVVLPSTPLRGNGVAWIDRYGVDVLTLVGFDATTAQIDVRGDTSTSHSGFSANPHDAVDLDGTRVLVTRYGVNVDPNATEFARGNDVVVVDQGHITQRLDVHADQMLGAACIDGECTIYARPAAMVPLGNVHARRILVVLDRLSLQFHHAGNGALVTIDPATLEVSRPMELGGVANCLFASVDASDPSRASVLCIGAPYTDAGVAATEDDRRATAAVVEVALDTAGGLTEVHRWLPGATAPVPSNGLIDLGGGRVLFVASGRLGTDEHDRIVDVSAGGAARIVYTAHDAFVLGEGVVTQAGVGSLVPDANVNGILCLWNGGVDGPATVLDTMTLDDCIGLPPRIIRPIR